MIVLRGDKELLLSDDRSTYINLITYLIYSLSKMSICLTFFYRAGIEVNYVSNAMSARNYSFQKYSSTSQRG